MKQGVNVSLITAACNARIMSNRIEKRKLAKELIPEPKGISAPEKAVMEGTGRARSVYG
ncbi:MAG: hypothetical protein ACLVJO_11075 [[Clostridium] scindens]